MKNIFLLFLISAYLIIPFKVNSQIKENDFYIGIGTSLSSYIGGDFGSTFAIRYWNNYNNDYYDNYYDRHYHYNDYIDGMLSPLQIDIALGTNVSKNIAFQLGSSFIWHLNGRIDPQYETGTLSNKLDYIDRYDNSTLLAIPIIASVKVYPFGRNIASFYISGGYGIQYTKESVDRIREVYDYSYSGYYGNSTLYDYTLANYWDARWFHGFKTAMGLTYQLNEKVSGEVELRFTNFYPSERINNSPLTMYRTPNLGNIALSTKIYFGM